MVSRLVATTLLLAAGTHAATIHVPGDESTIQKAIHAANSGDVVLVAPGTYYERFEVPLKAIQILGSGASTTVVDASRLWSTGFGGVVRFMYGHDSTTVLAGFTLTGGVASYGGGISCRRTSPTITHCTITGNSGRNWGDYGAQGGGIYCYESTATISHCEITNNSVESVWGYDWGGGIHCDMFSAPTITNCVISENWAGTGFLYLEGYGGGIGSYYESSKPVVTNCTITENSARWGSGIACHSASPRLTNCILWNERLDEVYGGSPILTYTNVQSGYRGQGNIDADPKFRSIKGFDYVLWPGSPCIDSGTGDDDSVDWSALNLRYGSFNSAAPDMGAYGGPGAAGWLE